MLIEKIVLCRLPSGVYYQMAGKKCFILTLPKALFFLTNLVHITWIGSAVSENLHQMTMRLKRKPKQTKRDLNKYYSTFLKDIASHKSDLSQYLDTLLYHKKRRLANQDHHQQPNKIVKLSQRQKKRLKNEEHRLPNRKKNTCGPVTTTIERVDLFYCPNSINQKTDKPSMRLPKERMY